MTQLIRWFIFTVVISLIPFAAFGWEQFGNYPLKTVWLELWPHGELLLVATAIAADGVGGLIATGVTKSKAKLVSGGLCVITLFFLALWYSEIQNHFQAKALIATQSNSSKMTKDEIAKDDRYKTRISEGSIVVFLLTICAGAGCKLLVE